MARLQKLATIFATVVLFTASASTARQGAVKVTEKGLRLTAIVSPKPIFPTSSLKAKASGPAVALIQFGAKGEPTVIDVVQSPDSAIRESVRTALRQWRITPFRMKNATENSEVIGRLVFYFLPKNQGLVLNPDEVIDGPKWNMSPLSAETKRLAINSRRPSNYKFEATKEIVESEIKTLRGSKIVILDLGERDEFEQDHYANAVNIPMDEMIVRVPIELPHDAYIVIDCRRNPALYKQAGTVLNTFGFGRVVLLMPGK